MDNKNFDLCVFDLDGTLVNSIDDLTDSVNYSLEKNNLKANFSTKQIMSKVGSGIKNLVKQSIDKNIINENLVQKVLTTFKAHYNTNCINKSKPYSGVCEMLQSLKKNGVKIAVLSNKADEMVKTIIVNLFGENVFDFVLGKRENFPLKPSPESLEYITQELNIAKERCAFIGDSSVDMQTANNANVFSIGVDWGYRSVDVLKENGAKKIVSTPNEILPIILKEERQQKLMINLYKNYCKEYFNKDGKLEKFEIFYPDNFNFSYDIVDKIAEIEPNRRAMLWCDDKGNEKTFTFGDMKKYSDKAANVLTKSGLKKGDKVMLILKRHYQFWFVVLALHKLGIIGIPATNLLTKKDIVYRFNAADIKGIIATTDDDIIEHVESALPTSPTVEVKISVKGAVEGWVDFDSELELASDKLERVDTKATDTMLIYFTSGTTGQPKMASHDYSYPLGHIMTAKNWHDVKPDGLHFSVSDSGWMKCMWGKLYGQWIMAGGVFVCDFNKFTPTDLLPFFAKYNITTFCAPPTMYRFLIREDLSKFDLSSLQHATIAGEALNKEVYDQFLAATGLKLMEGYGQTETTLTIYNPIGTNPKPGSMGIVSPAYEIELLDEDGNIVKQGETGEICVKTGDKKPVGMFFEYYKDKESTDKVWYDGYYHTGDTATQDEDGYFWYVGRRDDIIKSSGYRIGPFEIESVLIEHPCVLECAVTGVPDEIRGQVIKATIILAKGYKPSEELKKELQNHVKKTTAPYKYPRVVEFVDELPKTISGKIRRVAIREEDKKVIK